MAKSGWTDALAKFRGETKENLTQIVRKTAERVFEEAQMSREQGGRMPVESGDLRESLTFEGVGSGAESYRAAAAQMQPGDVLEGEWTKIYAGIAEFGGTNPNGTERPGNFFATEAANRFDEIVDEVAAEVVKK
jgi:histone H3/H4